MGSGRGGLHKGTRGSREGDALRARVNEAFSQFGNAAAGDAAADLAETLVRIAMGDPPEDAVPEPGEIAFDLALDALAPFVPGGGRVTRELGRAAKADRGARMDKVAEGVSNVADRMRELVRDESGYIRLSGRVRMSRAEYATVNSALNNMYHARLEGKGSIDVAIGDYRYVVQIHDFDEYTIVGKKRIV